MKKVRLYKLETSVFPSVNPQRNSRMTQRIGMIF